jgi:hydroxypyruvate reductase
VAAARDPRRGFLLSLFQAGLVAVNGRTRMRAALAGRDDLQDVWVIAAGKASSSMTLGALDALGPRIRRALVISREDCLDPQLSDHAGVTVLRGGHPVPDASSLEAGRAALQMAREAAPGRRVLLLVSGGASSLLEALPAGLGLPDLQRFTTWALGSGRDIAEVNAVRRRLSSLKDGRLLAALSHARVEGYYISDVPGDDPAVVGSGLLAVARGEEALPERLPDWVLGMVRQGVRRSAAVPDVPAHCVGNLDEARAAIVAAAGDALPVSCPPGRIEGDAVKAAQALCKSLARPGQRLWVLGGETTVVLPDRPGRGGRNQHLALAAAREIAGRDDLLVLAAGSDGSDGNTADAGALVDGGSLQRGEEGGCDAGHCLAAADSGRFLEASGDLVHTGATGTNVGDLVLGLCCEPGHSPRWRPSM